MDYTSRSKRRLKSTDSAKLPLASLVNAKRESGSAESEDVTWRQSPEKELLRSSSYPTGRESDVKEEFSTLLAILGNKTGIASKGDNSGSKTVSASLRSTALGSNCVRSSLLSSWLSPKEKHEGMADGMDDGNGIILRAATESRNSTFVEGLIPEDGTSEEYRNSSGEYGGRDSDKGTTSNSLMAMRRINMGALNRRRTKRKRETDGGQIGYTTEHDTLAAAFDEVKEGEGRCAELLPPRALLTTVKAFEQAHAGFRSEPLDESHPSVSVTVEAAACKLVEAADGHEESEEPEQRARQDSLASSGHSQCTAGQKSTQVGTSSGSVCLGDKQGSCVQSAMDTSDSNENGMVMAACTGSDEVDDWGDVDYSDDDMALFDQLEQAALALRNKQAADSSAQAPYALIADTSKVGRECVRGVSRVDASHTVTASTNVSPVKYKRFVVAEKVSTPGARELVLKCVAQEVTDNTCGGSGNVEAVRSYSNANSWTVKLREDWSDSMVAPGHIIHVIHLHEAPTGLAIDLAGGAGSDTLDSSRQIVVDNRHNLLVVAPDVLVPPTRVADTVECDRQAVLKSRLSIGNTSAAAERGKMKHELFERALVKACQLHAQQQGLQHEGSRMAQISVAAMGLEEDVDDIIRENLEACYAVDISDASAKDDLQGCLPALEEFMKVFVGGSSDAKERTMRNGGKTLSNVVPSSASGGVYRVHIHSVTGVEENIWSTIFGMRGSVDATVTATLTPEEGSMATGPAAAGRRHLRQPAEFSMMPIEFKTGKMAYGIGHRAQVVLYTLMLMGRYGLGGGPGFPNGKGFLVYLSAEGLKMQVVQPRRCEIRALLLARNRHALYLTKSLEVGLRLEGVGTGSVLPRVIREPRTCARCFQNAECLLYHTSVEGGDVESSGIAEEDFEAKVGHLSPSQLLYFSQWDRIIDLEFTTGERLKRGIYEVAGSVVEASTGTCLASLQLTRVEPKQGLGGSEAFTHQFQRVDLSRRSPNYSGELPGSRCDVISGPWLRGSAPLLSASLALGDRVIVSTEGRAEETSAGQHRLSTESYHRQICLLTGIVTSLTASVIEVTALRELKVPGVAMVGRCAVMHSLRPVVTDVEDIASRSVGGGESVRDSRMVFRIDRDEMSTCIKLMRTNLANLMIGKGPVGEDGDWTVGDKQRRRLVVDLEAPQFMQFHGLFTGGGTINEWAVASDSGERAQLQDEYDNLLNDDQQGAVRKVLCAKDYALLLGMPGTGKTSTIAYIVRLLVSRGSSVLITSYTHSGVDNLLLKLLEVGLPCLRLGNASSVHPGVQHCCLTTSDTIDSTATYGDVVKDAKIVGVTCLGVNHPVLSKRTFDICIVDEAGQISQPSILGPLRSAAVFVLVGDHYQLPPLVSNSQAREEGMDVSLFRRLSESHPSAVQTLSYQYRMNSDVMTLCNSLIYCNTLKCGNGKVAQQCLEIQHPERLVKPLNSSSSGGDRTAIRNHWLAEVLKPQRRVIFLDTDHVLPGEGGNACALEVKGAGGADRGRGGKGLLVNPSEASIVHLCLEALQRTGVDADSVGVISPYRSQVRLLSDGAGDRFKNVEMKTIDKYQGRDKAVIIVSFVRSNAAGDVGDLLRDWRRLNVALSRAKMKLIMVGSVSTLSRASMLCSLLSVVKSHGWDYQLPSGGLAFYPSLLPSAMSTPVSRREHHGPQMHDKGSLTNKHALLQEIQEECPGTFRGV